MFQDPNNVCRKCLGTKIVAINGGAHHVSCQACSFMNHAQSPYQSNDGYQDSPMFIEDPNYVESLDPVNQSMMFNSALPDSSEEGIEFIPLPDDELFPEPIITKIETVNADDTVAVAELNEIEDEHTKSNHRPRVKKTPVDHG